MIERSGFSAKENMRWPAPAKLNLMLRILGRRPDGYHSLQTVFQFIDRFDYLSFQVTENPEVRLTSPLNGVPEQNNLCVRAARLLKTECQCLRGVEIGIEKNLPMGGGLGGGSSDAATTLVALNELWDLGLPQARLMELGVRLGADVPVFINGVSAWAAGVGEILTPLEIPESYYAIVVPECHVSTAAVFNSPTLTRNNEPVTIKSFYSGWHENDCLESVSRNYPVVGLALKDLLKYGEARLTGTGACIFSAFDAKESADRAVSCLSKRWAAFVCKGLNRSPLLDCVAKLGSHG